MKGKEHSALERAVCGPCYWCGNTTARKDIGGEFCCTKHKDAAQLSVKEAAEKFPHRGAWIKSLSLYRNPVVLETIES